MNYHQIFDNNEEFKVTNDFLEKNKSLFNKKQFNYYYSYVVNNNIIELD